MEPKVKKIATILTLLIIILSTSAKQLISSCIFIDYES